MNRNVVVRRLAVASLLSFAIAAPVAAEWPPSSFKNLKVLPKDTPPRELIDQMAGFTRALGVRCTFCHVGEEGKPLSTYQFDLDDKKEKKTARAMIEMTQDLNSKYLANLPDRDDPPTSVQCVTCHHGVAKPRMLQDVLMRTYDRGGLDSTIVRYQGLRERYYGRAAYDFGDVALGDVATRVAQADHGDDAVRLHALNVEMNPKSMLAKRQHAAAAITQTYRDNGVAAGRGAYEDFLSRYGEDIVAPELMNEVGSRLLAAGKAPEAIAVFSLRVDQDPRSADTWVNLADAYAKTGDKKRATETYKKALALDAANARAKQGLEQLRHKSK